MGYIYGLIDPSQPEHIRYVGLTVTSLSTRLRSHRALSRRGRTPVNLWVRDLLERGDDPAIVELEKVEYDDDLSGREHAWITKFGLDRLLNVKMIGTGHSEETRTKLSARARNRKPEHQAKLNAALRGKKRPPETIAKIVAAQKGQKRGPQSSEAKANSRAARLGRPHPHKGTPHSPQALANRKAALEKRTAEQRAETSKKMSASAKLAFAEGRRIPPTKDPAVAAKMSATKKANPTGIFAPNQPLFACPYCFRECRGIGPFTVHERACRAKPSQQPQPKENE